ncbi:MAG: hypothetical protein DMF65_03960, partial [Acidobacteria bacterium]
RFGFDGFVFEGARVGMADSSTARTKSEKGGSREADFGVKRAGRLAVQISPRRAAGTCTAARAYTFRKAKVKRQKAKVKTQRQHDSHQPLTMKDGVSLIGKDEGRAVLLLREALSCCLPLLPFAFLLLLSL